MEDCYQQFKVRSKLYVNFKNLLIYIFFTGFENVNKEDYDACFDQFSNLIFYGSSDHKLHVWNITQQQEMMKFSMPQDRTVKKIAFSMNRMIFATAGGNHLQLWNETQYSE